MKIFHKLAMLGWVKIHRIAGCISSGSWLLAAASRRHAGHLIQDDCWEVPTQEPWEIRIGGLFSCRRWDNLLVSKGVIPIESPLLDGFLGVQAELRIAVRWDYFATDGWSTWITGFGGFWILPPHSHPVSSLRPRLASLFWASRNCWRAFARGTSSWKTCRVLMVMRVQKIWKNVIVEWLNRQSASAEKKQHALRL